MICDKDNDSDSDSLCGQFDVVSMWTQFDDNDVSMIVTETVTVTVIVTG
jgi:hypothetical protein